MTTQARAHHELRVLTGNGRPGHAHARRLRRHHRLVDQLQPCPCCRDNGHPDGCPHCGEVDAATRIRQLAVVRAVLDGELDQRDLTAPARAGGLRVIDWALAQAGV